MAEKRRFENMVKTGFVEAEETHLQQQSRKMQMKKKIMSRAR